jgi:hypothetical protein
MMLAAQIMYRHRRRNTHKLEIVHDNLQGNQIRKKRYDRAQMSSLLKATASGTSSPVLLAQPADFTAARNASQPDVMPPESHPAPAAPVRLAFEDENSAEMAEESSAAECRSLSNVES